MISLPHQVRSLARLLLVRDGEHGPVTYFLSVFIIMGIGMALGRGTTDALFFTRFGIEYLPLMYVLLGVLLASVSTLYAAFVDRMPAERFFKVIYGVLATVLAANWAVMAFFETSLIYPVYFLVYEIASELLLVHSALYLAQNLDTLQAKRLTPLIFAGLQIGKLAGGLLLAVTARHLDLHNVLLLWSALLLLGVIQITWWHKRSGQSTYFRAPRRERNPLRNALKQVGQGIKFTRESDLLRYSALAMFYMVIMFYMLTYSVNRVYTETFASEEALASFFGLLVAAGSILCLLLQIFLSNRLVDRYGVRKLNLVFPVTSLLGYVGLLINFSLPAAVFGSINKDALMPAFHSPVRSMFLNVAPSRMKGRAHAMTVVMNMPLALLVCGGILWVTQSLGTPVYFLLAGVTAAGLFLHYSLRMNGSYVRTLINDLKEYGTLPSKQVTTDLRSGREQVFNTLLEGFRQDDEQIALDYAQSLANSYPVQSVDIILPRVLQSSPAFADRLIRLIAPHAHGTARKRLRACLDQGDDHLRATYLRCLIQQGDEWCARDSEAALRSNNPRLRATGIHGVLRYPVEALHDEAVKLWRSFLNGGTNEHLAALDLIPDLVYLARDEVTELQRAYPRVFASLLQECDDEVCSRALASFTSWKGRELPEFGTTLARLVTSTNPRTREAAVRCLQFLPGIIRFPLLELALDDSNIQVRNAAIRVLQQDTRWLELATCWVAGENRGPPRAQQALLEAMIAEGLSVSDITDIAMAKADHARKIHMIMGFLNRIPGTRERGLELLQIVLAERLHQNVDLALAALEQISNTKTLAIIRAGLRSGDTRYVANACEALCNLDNQKIAQLLGSLLQGSVESQKEHGSQGQFRNRSSVLEWCRTQSDAWLQACALELSDGPDGAHYFYE